MSKQPGKRAIDYRCTSCGRAGTSAGLHPKIVRFFRGTSGSARKLLRTRTVAWLCKSCMEADPDYNVEPYKGTPGHESWERPT